MRFWISQRVFDPNVEFDEKKEVIFTVLGAAGIVFFCLIVGMLYSLAMMIAILPGVLGVSFGEKVYYGWQDFLKHREDEKYRRLSNLKA